MKPIEGRNTKLPYTYHKFNHEGDYHPCPTILTQFKDVELIPLFGLQRDIPKNRRAQKTCKEGLEKEVSRITQEEHKPELRLEKPTPKYQNCQVCKEEFQDYYEHINSFKHKDLVRYSQGTEYIELTIKECENAKYDLVEEEELA